MLTIENMIKIIISYRLNFLTLKMSPNIVLFVCEIHDYTCIQKV